MKIEIKGDFVLSQIAEKRVAEALERYAYHFVKENARNRRDIKRTMFHSIVTSNLPSNDVITNEPNIIIKDESGIHEQKP